MNRPEVRQDFSNIEEVCDYYSTHGPNPAFMRLYHTVMDAVCAPNPVIAPGASAEIEEHLAAERPTMLAMTHHSWPDPMNAGAAIKEKAVLRPIIGKTVIPARMDYFNIPVIGSIISIGGAKPVYRKKDLVHYYESQGLGPDEIAEKLAEVAAHRKDSNDRVRQIEAEMVDQGYIYASYVEGTRNRGDQTKLQKVQNGMRNLLAGMDNVEEAKVICMGYDYGGGLLMKRFLTPGMYVDIMDAAPVEDFNERLAETLQRCIDNAIATREKGLQLSPLAKAGLMGVALGGMAVAGKVVEKRRAHAE